MAAGADRPLESGLRALAIVPARIGSVRMPRKMLRRDTGRYLFEHTLRAVERCELVARAVVATDSEEVLAAAREAGIEAVATSPEHPSGTDRVREAARALGAVGSDAAFDVVLNVQGDEPELDPRDLAGLVGAFRDPEVEIATLWTPIRGDEAADPNVVKVVSDRAGWALYFSRAAIPSDRHPGAGVPSARRSAEERSDAEDEPLDSARRHVGVYAFRPQALESFCDLPAGRLERRESLEQLRWLEAGRRMRLVRASHAGADINTEEQYRAFVERERRRTSMPEGSGAR